MSKVNEYPDTCNLCGGAVVFTSNAAIYGRKYGSGMCYLCQRCGAYVGTHVPHPRKALGLLADKEMRDMKIACHAIFDAKWKGRNKASKKRRNLYQWLAEQMNIPVTECHFGHFDKQELEQAYRILKQVEHEELIYDNAGNIINTV